MMTLTTIPEIIRHIRGKFPQMVFVGKDYSVADLIADLERINRQSVKTKWWFMGK